MTLQALVEQLLEQTGASRVTLRQAAAGGYFGVTHEALAPGAPSVRDERTVDLRTNRVAQQAASGQQVVQHDCRAVDDDPERHRMLDLYGGLAAQIVTPAVEDGGRVVALVSVHQLGEPRRWSDEEIELCRQAAREAASLL
jgi:GAF domain-containing protein